MEGANTSFARRSAGSPQRPPNAHSVADLAERLDNLLDKADPTNYDRAFLPDAEEEESLGITITNEAIVGFNFHGDHADFAGKTTGTTTATFDLLHAGHPDFTSGALTIVVQ